uniref:Uncharacterized protein n=1 Tax=viral metagenome TaxID=1070528 RepID=A0A6C0EIG3_9ZZZZ
MFLKSNILCGFLKKILFPKNDYFAIFIARF